MGQVILHSLNQTLSFISSFVDIVRNDVVVYCSVSLNPVRFITGELILRRNHSRELNVTHHSYQHFVNKSVINLMSTVKERNSKQAVHMYTQTTVVPWLAAKFSGRRSLLMGDDTHTTNHLVNITRYYCATFFQNKCMRHETMKTVRKILNYIRQTCLEGKLCKQLLYKLT